MTTCGRYGSKQNITIQSACYGFAVASRWVRFDGVVVGSVRLRTYNGIDWDFRGEDGFECTEISLNRVADLIDEHYRAKGPNRYSVQIYWRIIVMPFKDPAKRKAWALEYQRPWMLDKLHERKAQGICRVSGCGAPLSSKQYCLKHLELNKVNSQDYRNRKKQQLKEATA